MFSVKHQSSKLNTRTTKTTKQDTHHSLLVFGLMCSGCKEHSGWVNMFLRMIHMWGVLTRCFFVLQVFQIAYIILKAANSPRPGNWILERSLDGENFMPWQYYAITDTECITRFNIIPRTGPPAYKHDDEVICTSFYSKIHPLENGEVSSLPTS